MKGLDRDELRLMQVIARGWWIGLLSCDFSVLPRLKKRGLVTESLVNCGADECPGHPELRLTPTGSLVLSAVTRVGI